MFFVMFCRVKNIGIGKYLFLLLVLCCTFFVNNDAIFVDIMESRNMITAREMVYDNNWLTPTMNGTLRLEKPPLPTWISAVVEYISPDNLGLQRAMAGLAAILLAFYLYLLAKELIRDKLYAFVSVLVLCTSYNIVLMGRTASWDIYCHAFMLMAIYYLYRIFQSEKAKGEWFVGTGVALGLSFLSKGPVSFFALLLPFLCAYFLIYHRSDILKGKWKGLSLAMFLLLAIGGWWYIYIYVYHPEMAEYVWNKESSSWSNKNVRPWYYYWKFFLETGAWAILVIFTWFVPFWKKRLSENTKPYLLVVSWMFFVVIFLSFMPEKKMRYLLPVSIPAVLSVSCLFYYWIRKMNSEDKLARLMYRLNGGLLTVVVFCLPVLLYWFMLKEERISLGSFCLNSCLLWIVALWMFFSVKQVKALSFLGSVVALFTMAEIFLMPYIGSFVANPEKKSIANTRQIEELKSIPFYYPAGDSVRIEMVYAAYKKIEKIDLNDSVKVKALLPIALVYGVDFKLVYPEWIKNNAVVEPIDIYDDNPWPKGHRLYKSDFIKCLTIIRNK